MGATDCTEIGLGLGVVTTDGMEAEVGVSTVKVSAKLARTDDATVQGCFTFTV